jgi:iron complex outermembrane receptor protein
MGLQTVPNRDAAADRHRIQIASPRPVADRSTGLLISVSLADVERIEVMSGPGGTVWGANAVNGVINVITANAHAGVGTMARAWAGDESHGLLLRHGWQLEGGGALRAYAKVHRREDSERASDADALDGLQTLQFGLRGDMDAANGALTLQGDAYKEAIRQATAADQRHHRANLLTRWTRALDDGASLTLKGYLDRSWRDIPGGYTENLGVPDLDVQALLPPGEGGQWTLGRGHRATHDDVGNYGTLAFMPASRRLHWTNAFVQYERELGGDATLTLGGSGR